MSFDMAVVQYSVAAAQLAASQLMEMSAITSSGL